VRADREIARILKDLRAVFALFERHEVAGTLDDRRPSL
jgi:hypothetical protein